MSAATCASAGKTWPSSCSPPGRSSPTAWWGSNWGPTTISPSPSNRPSCWRASKPCCGALARLRKPRSCDSRPETSTRISRRAWFSRLASQSRSRGRNSNFCATWWTAAARWSRATSCWRAYGNINRAYLHAPSTCMWPGCATNWKTIPGIRATSARCAAWVTASPADTPQIGGIDSPPGGIPESMGKFLLTGAIMAASLFGASSALDFTLNSIDGQPAPLSQYRGKVVLLVNVASKCGYTPQYAGLEAIYEKYKDKGFVVLGFPANNFKAQEPGADEEIKTFCTRKYNVTFPMYSKISVVGEDKAPLYQFLTDTQANPTTGGEIKWNFTKFLVGRDGKVVQRFEPAVTPDSPAVVSA